MYLGYKNQVTIKALKEKKSKRNDRNESEVEVTEEALQKLLDISVFIIKEHWVRTNNFEDFIQFVTKDLCDQVLEKYLKNVDNHKMATS